jgi:hypothetical protein
MALGALKVWIPGEVLYSADQNAEFANIRNNALTLISPLTGNLDVSTNELLFSDGGAASGVGRLRRNGNNLSWHDRIGAVALMGLGNGYLSGLTLSNDGTSPNTVLDIAAGVAVDSTNAALLRLTSAITKTTGAWAVGTGNGGLDTGSVAANTWYHVWLIQRPDTGVVDVLFSTSASAPTMPTNYTLRRRIGAFKTATGTTNILTFVQDGDYFRWLASILDINVTNPGAAAVTRTLTVPTGVNVYAVFNCIARDTTPTALGIYLSDLAANDEAPSTTAAPLGTFWANNAGDPSAFMSMIRTNTSAQIRSRVDASSANTILKIATLGWIDRRGRD